MSQRFYAAPHVCIGRQEEERGESLDAPGCGVAENERPFARNAIGPNASDQEEGDDRHFTREKDEAEVGRVPDSENSERKRDLRHSGSERRDRA